MTTHADPASITLDETVIEISGLRPLGAVTTQILAITAGDRSSAHQLARVISSDQALSAKMLRLANSAYYGFPREITTVRDAIVLLGFRAVRSSTLASCVIDAVPGGGTLDQRQFWRFGVTVGMFSELLARAGRQAHDEAFTAGALHNIGRLALDQHLPEAFARSLSYARKHDASLLDAQRAVLGFTDAELGGGLALHWSFPPSLVQAVASHQRSVYSLPESDSLAAVVIRARAFTRSLGLTDGAERPTRSAPPAEWAAPPLSVALERAGGVEGVMERVGAFLETAAR